MNLIGQIAELGLHATMMEGPKVIELDFLFITTVIATAAAAGNLNYFTFRQREWLR